MTAITERQQLAYVTAQAADARVNVELETEGHDPQHGPAAPGHPRHAAHRRQARRRAGHRLPSRSWATCTAATRSSPRSAPTRRSPRSSTASTGWAASPTRCRSSSPPRSSWTSRPRPGPSGSARSSSSCPASPTSRCSSATWPCSSAPSPPRFYAFRDREFVLNQIEAVTGGRFHPNFDRIGGLKDDLPKGWIAETKAAMEKIRDFCDEMETSSMGNEIFQARTRGIGVIPADVALSYGLSGANLRASRRRLGPPPRPAGRAWPGTRSTGRSGPTPTATRSPASGCASRRSARPPRSSTSCSTACPAGPIMAKVPAHHQGARGRGLGRHREPARRDGLLRRLQGRPRPVPGQDPLGERSTTSRSSRGSSAASTCPTSSRSSPASTSSSETSTGERTRPRHRTARTGRQTILRSIGIARRRAAAGRHVRLPLPVQDGVASCRAGSAPWRPGPYGSLQLLAEVGKFLQKEDIVPEQADRRLFKLAPYLVVGTVLLVYLAVPFGPDACVRRPRRRHLLRARRVVDLGRSASSSPAGRRPTSTRCIGGLRAAGQLIAYELPMVLAVVGVVIQAGTLNMQGIVAAQADGEIFGFGGLGNPFILTQFVGFVIFLIAVQAELTPDAVRHADRRVRARRRLHHRVLGHAVPAVLHRRVRHGRRLRRRRRHAVPRRLGPARGLGDLDSDWFNVSARSSCSPR